MRHNMIEVPFATKEEFYAFQQATGITDRMIRDMSGDDLVAACNKYLEDEKRKELIEKIVREFDFEKVHSVMYLTKKDIHVVPSVKDLKEQARKYLGMALDHQDREFWWAGGLHGSGGLCACWDNKWGLSLNYVLTAKRIKLTEL